MCIRGRIPKTFRTLSTKHFTDKKLTSIQVEKIIKIIQKEDNELILFPSKKDGEITYVIRKGTGIKTLHLPVLTFVESQLPQSYNWDKLSELFLSGRNLQLMQKYQLGEIKPRSFYESND